MGEPVSARIRFSQRARQVLIMRYMHDMTLDQVGQALGITRERVRQVEAKAIRKLQHPVRARKLAGFVDKPLEMQGVE